MDSLSACVLLVEHEINVLENEFPKETRETQKTILKNATTNFGIVAVSLNNISEKIGREIVCEQFSFFGKLLESAWETI